MLKQILTFKGNICKISWNSTFSHRSGLSFCLVKMQKKFSLSPFANGTQAFTLLASKQPKTQTKKKLFDHFTSEQGVFPIRSLILTYPDQYTLLSGFLPGVALQGLTDSCQNRHKMHIQPFSGPY